MSQAAFWKIPLTVSAQVGSARLTMAQVHKIGYGTVIELDRTPDDLVDLCVGDVRFGTGDVEIIEGMLFLRVNHLTLLGSDTA